MPHNSSLSAWEARCHWREWRKVLRAIDARISHALDGQFASPLSTNGVSLLEIERAKVLTKLQELERLFR